MTTIVYYYIISFSSDKVCSIITNKSQLLYGLNIFYNYSADNLSYLIYQTSFMGDYVFRIKKSFNVFLKISKVSVVIFLFSLFTFSIVNAQESSSANTSSDYTTNSKSDDGKGIYVLGQIGYNGAYADPYGYPAGFTVNGLLGYQYLKFLSAEGSIGFKLGTYNDEGTHGGGSTYESSQKFYAMDLKLYPLVFRREFKLGKISIIPRIGLGVGLAFGKVTDTYTSSYPLSPSLSQSDHEENFVLGITALVPIGVTFAIGNFLVGFTIEPAFGSLQVLGMDTSLSLIEGRFTLDLGYKF